MRLERVIAVMAPNKVTVFNIGRSICNFKKLNIAYVVVCRKSKITLAFVLVMIEVFF